MTKTYHQERAEKLLKRASEQFPTDSKEYKAVAENFGAAPAPEKAAAAPAGEQKPKAPAKKRNKRKKKKACKAPQHT
ncbi:MAG: hypothetical protein KGZ69_03780 [Methylomonas sp.]|nr:hypothetical protein [Methylomonas sp.]